MASKKFELRVQKLFFRVFVLSIFFQSIQPKFVLVTQTACSSQVQNSPNFWKLANYNLKQYQSASLSPFTTRYILKTTYLKFFQWEKILSNCNFTYCSHSLLNSPSFIHALFSQYSNFYLTSGDSQRLCITKECTYICLKKVLN